MKTVCIMVAVLVAGCGGDDGGGQHIIGADASPDTAVIPGADLVGTWSFSVCGSTSQNKLRRTLTATTDTFMYVNDWFDDADATCATPYAQLRVNESYVVGPAGAIDPAAHKIDVRTAGTTITFVSATAAANANSSAYCGYTDWQVNQAKDVAGVFCAPDEYWSVGHVLYDLYKVDGGRMYFGDPATGSGTSDGTRPTQILTSSWYTRQ